MYALGLLLLGACSGSDASPTPVATALNGEAGKKVLAALQDNGYAPDTRFHGQASLGTFPMDADFSPDGNHIVFDGAVEKNGEFGLIIFSMTTSGDNITSLTDMIEANPAFSNGNNYSQLNPNWR